ncbi:MAG: DUF177 domain-containing protein [Methyloceanibacter sp.]
MKTPATKDSHQDTAPPPLARTFRVDEIKDGEDRLIEIGQAERQSLAALLDLAALDRLSFVFRFDGFGEGRFALHGKLRAAATQTCVVSLDPVESALEIPVELEFWPARLVETFRETADETTDRELRDWPEPIADGKIDLGPIIYQTLATGLDPYPKREGASFAWPEDGSPEMPKGPFAALEQLKQRR